MLFLDLKGVRLAHAYRIKGYLLIPHSYTSTSSRTAIFYSSATSLGLYIIIQHPSPRTYLSRLLSCSQRLSRAGRSIASASYYESNSFTTAEIVFPSALPANSLEASPITFPISFIEDAPVREMIPAIAVRNSSSESCFGK